VVRSKKKQKMEREMRKTEERSFPWLLCEFLVYNLLYKQQIPFLAFSFQI